MLYAISCVDKKYNLASTKSWEDYIPTIWSKIKRKFPKGKIFLSKSLFNQIKDSINKKTELVVIDENNLNQIIDELETIQILDHKKDHSILIYDSTLPIELITYVNIIWLAKILYDFDESDVVGQFVNFNLPHKYKLIAASDIQENKKFYYQYIQYQNPKTRKKVSKHE